MKAQMTHRELNLIKQTLIKVVNRLIKTQTQLNISKVKTKLYSPKKMKIKSIQLSLHKTVS